jgi:hypothetical protein
MASHGQDADLLRAYFLGKLGEQEREQVEERLYGDDELFELAEAVEAEILEEYWHGELPPEDRQQIVRRLMFSSRSRALLTLTQDLATVAGASAPPAMAAAPGDGQIVPFRRRLSQPVLRFAMAAGLAGVLVTAGVLHFRGIQTDQAVEQTALSEIRLSAGGLSTRGGERGLKTAPLSSAGLRIHLTDLGPEYPACEVKVERGGHTVLQERVPVEQGSASVEIPAADLAAGHYEIEVQGIPAQGEPADLILDGFEITP